MSILTRVGTAAWSIPRAVADRFSDGPSVLARYATVFDAVEINSSFYRPHRRATYARWAASVPDGFRFAVKMPKAITHEKRLVAADAEIDRFLEETAGLGEKRGPLLIQLPPSLKFSADIAGEFLRDLRARTDAPLACEPRHPSWFKDDVGQLLVDNRMARVAADPACVPLAATCGGWTGLRYIRLHGSPRVYYSNYEPAYLANIVADLAGTAVETWCIFDNTALGAATANALDTRSLLLNLTNTNGENAL